MKFEKIYKSNVEQKNIYIYIYDEDENLETQKIYAEDESDERYEKIGKYG